MSTIDNSRTFNSNEVNNKYSYYCKLVEEKLKNHQKPHDRRYHQGFFIPKRPIKCMNIMEVGDIQPIVWRSSWEEKFMEWLDSNDVVTRWGSEIISIPYKDPLKGKMSLYVPDFYMEYIDNQGTLQKYLIEIKPMSQSKLTEAKDGYDRLRIAKNAFKWAQAIKYCKKKGITFKVMTEYELGIK